MTSKGDGLWANCSCFFNNRVNFQIFRSIRESNCSLENKLHLAWKTHTQKRGIRLNLPAIRTEKKFIQSHWLDLGWLSRDKLNNPNIRGPKGYQRNVKIFTFRAHFSANIDHFCPFLVEIWSLKYFVEEKKIEMLPLWRKGDNFPLVLTDSRWRKITATGKKWHKKTIYLPQFGWLLFLGKSHHFPLHMDKKGPK